VSEDLVPLKEEGEKRETKGTHSIGKKGVPTGTRGYSSNYEKKLVKIGCIVMGGKTGRGGT